MHFWPWVWYYRLVTFFFLTDKKKMKVLLFLAATVVLAQARSLTCDQLYRANGFSANLNETIAHAIHSMNVEGLQMFNPHATERNMVPTVNLDRSSPQKVLPYAPRYPLGSDFTTTSMNMVDKILSQIGNAKDGLGPNWSPVERIAHAFHMRDLWYRVHQVYQSRVVPNPPSDELCACLTNTKSNGIYQVKCTALYSKLMYYKVYIYNLYNIIYNIYYYIYMYYHCVLNSFSYGRNCKWKRAWLKKKYLIVGTA